MYTFLLVLLILDAIILAAAVLLQSGKGGGLAASFGGASSSPAVLGSRQAGDLLTKTSWWAGGIFIFLAFVLQLMSTRSAAPKSILDDVAAPAPAAATPAPTTGPGDQAPAGLPLQAAPTAPTTTPPQQ
ncbi:MAG: preprotein translocase subunit SecG [Gemmatimonadota bacterium]|jgi:preprotein translocase subunit SecG|nr:preprotein translocase subunit SecG [Gemmatimonadota bacterium]MDQ8152403.1 preprotein translocase subunit SecG [Gemmatimonadota bacterium]MDQ8178804.1 preprotein translocase subunit SecG [Gemmatimonadota bacterium]